MVKKKLPQDRQVNVQLLLPVAACACALAGDLSLSLCEDGGGGEPTLECTERLLGFGAPLELPLWRRESMERSCYRAEASEKPPVKVSKPEELLNLLAAVGGWPLGHSANFSRVHLYTSGGYDEVQERDSVGMEQTLFCFDIQVISQQSFENLVDVITVGVEVRRVNENIINVNIDKAIKKISENIVNHGLKNCGGISESERHNSIFVVATGGVERSFPLVPLPDADQMVGVSKV